jgi:hypothetical protein
VRTLLVTFEVPIFSGQLYAFILDECFIRFVAWSKYSFNLTVCKSFVTFSLPNTTELTLSQTNFILEVALGTLDAEKMVVHATSHIGQ